jgi:hypothetical protein
MESSAFSHILRFITIYLPVVVAWHHLELLDEAVTDAGPISSQFGFESSTFEPPYY